MFRKCVSVQGLGCNRFWYWAVFVLRCFAKLRGHWAAPTYHWLICFFYHGLFWLSILKRIVTRALHLVFFKICDATEGLNESHENLDYLLFCRLSQCRSSILRCSSLCKKFIRWFKIIADWSISGLWGLWGESCFGSSTPVIIGSYSRCLLAASSADLNRTGQIWWLAWIRFDYVYIVL